jgi:hypothetical protein
VKKKKTDGYSITKIDQVLTMKDGGTKRNQTAYDGAGLFLRISK